MQIIKYVIYYETDEVSFKGYKKWLHLLTFSIKSTVNFRLGLRKAS